jgi:hypothetical protein
MQETLVSDDSLTNRVAIGFVENYFNSRQGSNLSPEEKEYLVNGISQQVIQEISINPIYSVNQLDVFVANSEPEKLINYTDAFLARQVDILAATLDNLTNNDFNVLSSVIFQKSKELMQIETPALIAKEHVDLANTYYQLAIAVESFDEENEDPLYVMLAVKIYEDAQIKIEDINSKINNFLKDNGIIITDNGIEIENE